MPPGLQPAHKMSIILFLERVYGIPDQETFFRLLEDAFLPDIRAATILDMVKNFFQYFHQIKINSSFS
jgi:ryanodine receptor 2